MRRAILAVLLVATVARAQKQPEAQVAANDPVTLDEVVVTGSKMEEDRWDSTVPTQVISEEKIEESATIDLENVLGEIPGMYVRKNEQFGLGASTVRMQGADPNKVAILMDGRRFRGGIDGVVDLRDIPANNVQRVEITRGPASSLYGSDAMAGVVNIITRQGGPEPTAEAVASWGSFDRQFYAASHGWQVGPVRYFLSGLHDEFKIFEQFGQISAQFSGLNRDATQNRDQIGLRMDLDVGESHGFTLFPSYLQVSNPESTNKDLVTSGEWRWRTGPGSNLTTWLNFYNFTRSNDLEDFEEDSDYKDWEGESRWGVEVGPWLAWQSHLLTLGTRARFQTLDQTTRTVTTASGAKITPDVSDSTWQVSPFVQSNILFSEHWSLLVGSSFDVHQNYGLDVNPRATLTWWPLSVFRLSGTIGKGFRAPDLGQLFDNDVNLGGAYVLLGNPDLQPETDLAFQLEAQVRLRGVESYLTLFRHQFDDLIDFQECKRPNQRSRCIDDPFGPGPNNPPALRFQTQNLSSAITQGLELGIDLSVLDVLGIDSEHKVDAGIGYAFLDSKNESTLPGQEGNELPFRPKNRVLPSFGWRNRAWGTTVRVWGEYESDAFTNFINSPETIARNHWLWNFKVTIYPLRALPEGGPRGLAEAIGIGKHFAFFAQGENVFDQEFGLVTAMGRLAGPAAFLFGVQAKY